MSVEYETKVVTLPEMGGLETEVTQVINEAAKEGWEAVPGIFSDTLTGRIMDVVLTRQKGHTEQVYEYEVRDTAQMSAGRNAVIAVCDDLGKKGFRLIQQIPRNRQNVSMTRNLFVRKLKQDDVGPETDDLPSKEQMCQAIAQLSRQLAETRTKLEELCQPKSQDPVQTTQNAADVQPVKRKRGRPRKNPESLPSSVSRVQTTSPPSSTSPDSSPTQS